MKQPLLDVQNLRVDFATGRGTVHALKGVSVTVHPGETLGVVGESGSGKSVTALAILGLLARHADIRGGRILFDGMDVTPTGNRTKLERGRHVAMVFQNPRGALNPVRKVGDQLLDVLQAHRNETKAASQSRSLELLSEVGFDNAARVANSYAHEMSGGMCQRAMIAMAIACDPKLLLADEPTTGLDVTTQKTIMDLLERLVADRNMAMMLITHDLGLAARYCRRVAVMEQGCIVEENDAHAVFTNPSHPYTQRLVDASPRRDSLIDDLVTGERLSVQRPAALTVRDQPIIEVKNLIKKYGDLTAVNDVSFSVNAGESVGLVGESGSGKSTISRLLTRLIESDSGHIIFNGQDITSIAESVFHRSPLRRDIQIVFQDASGGLNPRFRAFDCIADPIIRLTGKKSKVELTRQVHEIASRVKFDLALLDRLPHQLSGGQRARIGIGRAIAVRPKLLILDEPTASLDVSIQAAILQLLETLRREDGLSYIFVSHDLSVVRMLCERIVVLKSGSVVEVGDTKKIFEESSSPYTQQLLASIPYFEAQKMPVGA